MNRRDLLGLLAGACTAAGPATPAWAEAAAWPAEVPLGPARPFSFEALKARAAALARRPFRPAPAPPPELVRAIDYDAFGAVRYRPQATLWRDAPGDAAIRLFPLGRAAPRPVAVNVVSAGQARPVLYSDALFEAPPDSPVRRLSTGLGFGGFRAMNAGQESDWLAFLGAAYFRSADPFNQYGLSARGLAIDTATPRPEEFPAFTAFWLERTAEGRLVVCALLDGPSVTGAIRFACARGPSGLVQDVEAELAFRAPVERLGVAPLTSMYWYGQSDRRPEDDWRPQIHDSDGLSIWTGAGERIWRPLADPPYVITNSFQDRAPRGYGLMQRDRRFEDYQDDGVFYDRRPSAWVEPVGDWGPGAVELVEIPTSGESDDNIVAFWTPAAPVRAGSRLAYRYRLHWTGEEPDPLGVARVVATRSGRGGRPGQPVPPGRRKFVVDFEGGGLDGLVQRGDAEPVVTVDPGGPIDAVAYPVAGTSLWRLVFDVRIVPGAVVNMRAYLRKGQNALTETWFHQAFGA